MAKRYALTQAARAQILAWLARQTRVRPQDGLAPNVKRIIDGEIGARPAALALRMFGSHLHESIHRRDFEATIQASDRCKSYVASGATSKHDRRPIFELPPAPSGSATPNQATPQKPITVHIVGTDPTVQQLQPGAPLQDGAQVVAAPNATTPPQPPQPVHVIDHRTKTTDTATGVVAGINYAGEPQFRQAILDAIRTRHRGRTVHGLAEGDIDFSRIALTGAGLDLGSAYSRDERPDLRGVAVQIYLDASGSMSCSEKLEPLKSCAAMTVRALARSRVPFEVCQFGYTMGGNGNKWGPEILSPFGAPMSKALDAIGRFTADGATDVLAALRLFERNLLARREPRRVLVVVTDGCFDSEPTDDLNRLRKRGVETWLFGISPESHNSAALPCWDIAIAGLEPTALAGAVSNALRSQIGKVLA